jgi:hypothetical protein
MRCSSNTPAVELRTRALCCCVSNSVRAKTRKCASTIVKAKTSQAKPSAQTQQVEHIQCCHHGMNTGPVAWLLLGSMRADSPQQQPCYLQACYHQEQHGPCSAHAPSPTTDRWQTQPKCASLAYRRSETGSTRASLAQLLCKACKCAGPCDSHMDSPRSSTAPHTTSLVLHTAKSSRGTFPSALCVALLQSFYTSFHKMSKHH